MNETKSDGQTQFELKNEIKSILDKEYNTLFIKYKDQRDKRRFTKIFDIKLNELIFKSDIKRKYIDFFILLVNINSRYIETDPNMINLTIKQIAENMQYSTVHTVHIYNFKSIMRN